MEKNKLENQIDDFVGVAETHGWGSVYIDYSELRQFLPLMGFSFTESEVEDFLIKTIKHIKENDKRMEKMMIESWSRSDRMYYRFRNLKTKICNWLGVYLD